MSSRVQQDYGCIRLDLPQFAETLKEIVHLFCLALDKLQKTASSACSKVQSWISKLHQFSHVNVCFLIKLWGE